MICARNVPIPNQTMRGISYESGLRLQAFNFETSCGQNPKSNVTSLAATCHISSSFTCKFLNIETLKDVNQSLHLIDCIFWMCYALKMTNSIQHQNLGGSHYSSAGCMIYRPAVYRNLNYCFYVKEKQQSLDDLFGINMRKIILNTRFNRETTSRVMICYTPSFMLAQP